jgi:phage FluMu protein Com
VDAYERIVTELRCWFCDRLHMKIMHHKEVIIEAADEGVKIQNDKIFIEIVCPRCKRFTNKLAFIL